MKKSDFYFELPPECIAQTPVEPRDHSRLLTLDRKTGEMTHGYFYDLKNLLHPGDLLVINDSKVLPARLYGQNGRGGALEILLLTHHGDDVWEMLVRPGRRARVGDTLIFGDGKLTGTVTAIGEDGNRFCRFHYAGASIYEVLDELGQMPLPPYITEKLSDQGRYQTVYAKELGSAAAPTAGLHFTRELLEELEKMGVGITRVTLHVGLGTFRPVKEDEITDHVMHTEHYHLPAETAQKIRQTHAHGGRVIAVGTTSCRTLEGVANKLGRIAEDSGETDIFIYPGYSFRVIDGLITNFHLPESTLIMLVSALAGRENILRAYETAIREGYRFFSFGDAMFIR